MSVYSLAVGVAVMTETIMTGRTTLFLKRSRQIAPVRPNSKQRPLILSSIGSASVAFE